MKITAIKRQVKNENRASFFVDGKYSFSLTLDQLISENLKTGIDLSESELKALKKKSSDGKLKMRVIEWLCLRPRSEKELSDYLRKKNSDPDFSLDLVNEMKEKKYLSNEHFAKWYIELKTRQLKSKKEITYSLRQKGIDSQTVNELIEMSEDFDSENLKKLILKKRLKYNDETKLMAYLVRKGYLFSDVKEALAEG
jgi:regulatory protein